jgi:hypothetical protein
VNTITGWITGERGVILKTINGGFNWYYQAINGSSYNLTKSYFVNESIGYIAGDSAIVLKTTDGGGAFIGISSNHNSTPSEFRLFQNYPNPFNPATKITFALPESGNVNLVVFDLLGKEVEVLVNEHLPSGNFEVNWDASNYPSGTYFYRLSTNNFTEAKKC